MNTNDNESISKSAVFYRATCLADCIDFETRPA